MITQKTFPRLDVFLEQQPQLTPLRVWMLVMLLLKERKILQHTKLDSVTNSQICLAVNIEIAFIKSVDLKIICIFKYIEILTFT